jgi:hypothetical protein
MKTLTTFQEIELIFSCFAIICYHALAIFMCLSIFAISIFGGKITIEINWSSWTRLMKTIKERFKHES